MRWMEKNALMYLVWPYVCPPSVTACPVETLVTHSLDLPCQRCCSFTVTSWHLSSSFSRESSILSAPGNNLNMYNMVLFNSNACNGSCMNRTAELYDLHWMVCSSLWLRDFMLPEGTGVSQASASGSLLYRTFWTVWERTTLLSQAVKQLTQLLVQAAMEVNTTGLMSLLFSLVAWYMAQHCCFRSRNVSWQVKLCNSSSGSLLCSNVV